MAIATKCRDMIFPLRIDDINYIVPAFPRTVNTHAFPGFASRKQLPVDAVFVEAC